MKRALESNHGGREEGAPALPTDFLPASRTEVMGPYERLVPGKAVRAHPMAGAPRGCQRSHSPAAQTLETLSGAGKIQLIVWEQQLTG